MTRCARFFSQNGFDDETAIPSFKSSHTSETHAPCDQGHINPDVAMHAHGTTCLAWPPRVRPRRPRTHTFVSFTHDALETPQYSSSRAQQQACAHHAKLRAQPCTCKCSAATTPLYLLTLRCHETRRAFLRCCCAVSPHSISLTAPFATVGI
jgi:hypothetical protein